VNQKLKKLSGAVEFDNLLSEKHRLETQIMQLTNRCQNLERNCYNVQELRGELERKDRELMICKDQIRKMQAEGGARTNGPAIMPNRNNFYNQRTNYQASNTNNYFPAMSKNQTTNIQSNINKAIVGTRVQNSNGRANMTSSYRQNNLTGSSANQGGQAYVNTNRAAQIPRGLGGQQPNQRAVNLPSWQARGNANQRTYGNNSGVVTSRSPSNNISNKNSQTRLTNNAANFRSYNGRAMNSGLANRQPGGEAANNGGLSGRRVVDRSASNPKVGPSVVTQNTRHSSGYGSRNKVGAVYVRVPLKQSVSKKSSVHNSQSMEKANSRPNVTRPAQNRYVKAPMNYGAGTIMNH
jgi:hypothetical protein